MQNWSSSTPEVSKMGLQLGALAGVAARQAGEGAHGHVAPHGVAGVRGLDGPPLGGQPRVIERVAVLVMGVHVEGRLEARVIGHWGVMLPMGRMDIPFRAVMGVLVFLHLVMGLLQGLMSFAGCIAILEFHRGTMNKWHKYK